MSRKKRSEKNIQITFQIYFLISGRKYHSITLARCILEDISLRSIDHIFVSNDLMAAFDSVDSKILLKTKILQIQG